MPARKLDRDRVWTREEVLALPDDGNRYELVDGMLLVSPSPKNRHQRVVRALFRLVDPYVERHAIGETLFAPADLDLRSSQFVQPDLFVLPLDAGRSRGGVAAAGIPMLVAEVLSPSSVEHDRVAKRQLYQKAGVATYWIVDLDARAFEVWTPRARKPVIETQRVSWHPEAAAAPLVIGLEMFFAEDFGTE